jgi:glycosyltransferase involved in cell wall biosynthesis
MGLSEVDLVKSIEKILHELKVNLEKEINEETLNSIHSNFEKTCHLLYSNIEKINKSTSNVKVANEVYKFFYIGTLGYSYDLNTLVSSFDNIVVDGRRCELHIFGSGPMRAGLENISSLNVIYHGFVEWNIMYEIIGEMDFAVNPIKKMAAQSITNKISDYISLGYPILSCQESLELDELLANQPYLKYEAGSVDSLVNAVKLMCSYKGEMISDDIREKFVRKKAYKEILNFLEFFK